MNKCLVKLGDSSCVVLFDCIPESVSLRAKEVAKEKKDGEKWMQSLDGRVCLGIGKVSSVHISQHCQ